MFSQSRHSWQLFPRLSEICINYRESLDKMSSIAVNQYKNYGIQTPGTGTTEVSLLSFLFECLQAFCG